MMKTKLVLTLAIFIFGLFGMAQGSEAATLHCGSLATGNGSGSDWSNQCNFNSMTLVRGNTYYLADGSYGDKTFNTAVSGTTYIYVKKATVTSHGVTVGWQDSYGDGAAEFSKWTMTTSYWELDGQVGQWASDLPGYVPYGFQVKTNTITNGDHRIRTGTHASPASHIILKHVEAAQTNTTTWADNQDILNNASNYVLISYCWFHHGGRCIWYNDYKDNVTVEYSVLEQNGHSGRTTGEHSEIAALWGDPNHVYAGPTNVVLRYSYVRDQCSTGGIMIMGSQGQQIDVYGNIFTDTGYWNNTQCGDANGILSGLDSAQTVNATARAYNNTFVNIDHGAVVLRAGTYVVNETRNNLFYNVHNWSGSTPSQLSIGGTHDYNWFYNSGAQSEAHIQNGTGSPFVDLVNRDYRLFAPTNAGDRAIGSAYDHDMLGVVRGADGNWDRGAYEYVSKTQFDTTAPAAPAGLVVQ